MGRSGYWPSGHHGSRHRPMPEPANPRWTRVEPRRQVSVSKADVSAARFDHHAAIGAGPFAATVRLHSKACSASHSSVRAGSCARNAFSTYRRSPARQANPRSPPSRSRSSRSRITPERTGASSAAMKAAPPSRRGVGEAGGGAQRGREIVGESDIAVPVGQGLLQERSPPPMERGIAPLEGCQVRYGPGGEMFPQQGGPGLGEQGPPRRVPLLRSATARARPADRAAQPGGRVPGSGPRRWRIRHRSPRPPPVPHPVPTPAGTPQSGREPPPRASPPPPGTPTRTDSAAARPPARAPPGLVPREGPAPPRPVCAPATGPSISEPRARKSSIGRTPARGEVSESPEHRARLSGMTRRDKQGTAPPRWPKVYYRLHNGK